MYKGPVQAIQETRPGHLSGACQARSASFIDPCKNPLDFSPTTKAKAIRS